VFDITNQAKQHWNSISFTHQERIISKFKERLQLLCAVDELCVPAFVDSGQIGVEVDDIGTMLD
jgi:hypothetical protein